MEPKEELFSSLLNFSKKEKIKSGFFYGLGACQKCVIGSYDFRKKKYLWKKINQPMEICSLIGNLTLKENELFLHIHVVLADNKLKSFSGHLKEAIIYPTCEIILLKFNKKIIRNYNPLINLYLIDHSF
ncbi:MAG: DNA-binding protein [Patescibacteria group bacterium]|nr:DNA-binding protein [Patescibacteria group bacterium]